MIKLLVSLGVVLALGLILFYMLATPVLVMGKPKHDSISIPVSIDRLTHDVQVLCTTSKPRNYANLDALNEAASYIQKELEKAGFKTEEQKYIADGNEYKNILCSYGPKDAPRIILGAHYDVCEDQPGADDNASGVAGLLEVARLLGSQKPILSYRVDLVAFTLEEPPYFRTEQMGSAVHANYIVQNKIPVKAMICLEMIGYFTDEPHSQDYPVGVLKTIYPTKGDFIAVVGRMGENDLAKDIKKRMMESSTIGIESINAPKQMVGIDFSDHQNYWKHDLPAVMITNTSFYRNKNYHQVTDTPETLDYKRMAEVVKGIYYSITKMK